MSPVWSPGLASVNVAPERMLLSLAPSVPAATAALLPVNAASATVAVPLIVVVLPPSSTTLMLMA